MSAVKAYLVKMGAAEFEVTGFDEASARRAARVRYIDAHGDYQIPVATVRAMPLLDPVSVEDFVREFGPGLE